jgi:intracellular septation protein
VLLVGLANPPDTIDCLAVTNVTSERIAGVRRIGYQAPALYGAHHHCDASRLRIGGVHFDEFGHARIVWERWLRGYPFNTLLFAAFQLPKLVPMTLIIEFLPLMLFLGAFLYKDIYFALVVLMIAMPIGLIVKFVRTQKFDKMYFWSTVLLLIGGGLTLYFRNPLFLYWKPTVFYWAVAVAFLGSQFFSEAPFAQKFFGLIDGLNIEKISAAQWNRLNMAWVAFFVGAGVLNIYVALNFEQATWVKFKVFGLTALTFIFMISQTFWIANLIGEDESEEKEQE